MKSAVSPDYPPTATWEMLRRRAELLQKVRLFFTQRDFLEVETPILSHDIVVDRHLDPFSTILAPDPRMPEQGTRLWLQTSPEFHMKRMMAAGGEAIFQVSRVFRNGEVGQFHNPEFTMIEWYRRGDGLQAGMRLLSELIEFVLETPPATEQTFAQALQKHAAIDPLAATTQALIERVQQLGLAYPESMELDDRDAWLDILWTELVEPYLGAAGPEIIYNYPASQAALALVSEADPRVAERFELYLSGRELANGYHELLDPEVLLQRNRSANQMRSLDGKPELPEDSRLITAMQQGLPACTGVALGFDRLVMLATGASSIAEVIAFPADRA